MVNKLKKYSFHIDDWQLDQFFCPLRDKKSVIVLLMKTIKLMLINQDLPKEKRKGRIDLVVSKMSRLFFFSDNKYFSISFPFFVSEQEHGFIFSSKYLSDVDSKVTSDVISIISNDLSFDSYSVYDFIDPIMVISDFELNFWPFLLDLFLFEDGYIRYDFDEVRCNGFLHPLNHYDVFYSASSTFKIGLKNRLGEETMIDFLRLESNCHFLDDKLV